MSVFISCDSEPARVCNVFLFFDSGVLLTLLGKDYSHWK